MKRRYLDIALVALLVLLDVFFTLRAVEMASIYPFDRIIIGNTFVYNINFLKRSEFYNHRLLTINDIAVNENTVHQTLSKLRNETEFNLTLLHNGVPVQATVSHSGLNRRALWFFMIMLLFANIHFAYGIMVRLFRAHSHQSRLFIYTSLGLSLFYFCLIDLFSFCDFKYIFLTVIVLLGFLTVLVGYNLSRERLSRSAITIFTATTAVLLTLMPDYMHRPFDIFALKTIFIYLLLFAVITIGMLFTNMLRERQNYIVKRESLIITGILLAYVLPLSIYIGWLFLDLPPYIHILTSFTLIIPLLIGNSIFQYNLFSFRLFARKGIVLSLKNLFIALITAAFLFYTSWKEKNILALTLDYGIFIVLLAYVLHVGRAVSRRVSNIIYVNKDRYSQSLQDIENLAASPEDLGFKVERIFTEARNLIGTSTIKLVLFTDSFDLKKGSGSGFIELLPRDSVLHSYFRKNAGTLIRHFLLKNSPTEERVYGLLEANGAVLATPVRSGRDVTGALLVGEKANRDLFNGIDINYLETVALQTGQFLENDRLFKDYIIKRRFEMELDIASYVQMRLFPKKAPSRKKLLISFYNRPYLKVTGDYFDFIDIDKENTAVIIGDISGHGLAAAMILTMTSSIMHAMLREKKPLAMAIEEINHFLNNRYRGTELITLFAGMYNNSTRELTYINAGHCAPLLINQAKRQHYQLEGRSKIIGADPNAVYYPSKITLNKNDELVLYTDGAIEIYDEKADEGFTEKKLIELVIKNIDQDIERKINDIAEAISKFNGSIRDDITLIAVKFL